MKRVFALFLPAVLLSGCTLSQRQPDNLLAEQQSLLEQQQLRLDEQAGLLDDLLASQSQLADQMDNLQQQVGQLAVALTKAANDDPKSELEKPVFRLEEKPPVETVREVLRREDKVVVGRVEWVWLDIAKQRFKARVDTGAATSSLHARNLQPFERNGNRWVRFTIPGVQGEKTFETPLVRHKKVRQATAEDTDKRPVVLLMVRIGEISEEIEFNLSDRDNMLYPVLLGRNFLQDIAVVDVARKFTQPKVELETP